MDNHPKTADGVTIYFGMRVYSVRRPYGPSQHPTSIYEFEVDLMSQYHVWPPRCEAGSPSRDCYSTREAAEKAIEMKP